MTKFIDSIQNNFNYCSDCGIFRYKSPKPGTCPCCFSRMKKELSVTKQFVHICVNPDCRRIDTGSYLSGFWSGWREKEREIT